MAKRYLLTEESTTSLAKSGFSITAKWRLLTSMEDTEESENIDSSLLDPSEVRDNRSKGIHDGNKDEDSDKDQKVTPIVKKL